MMASLYQSGSLGPMNTSERRRRPGLGTGVTMVVAWLAVRWVAAPVSVCENIGNSKKTPHRGRVATRPKETPNRSGRYVTRSGSSPLLVTLSRRSGAWGETRSRPLGDYYG